ncbi:MAG: type II toxin-antitoxin system VapC family toxin [Treponemataceae bacterium]|nr:type II toxin-antitoxin system VapC family toxin [Treponemataceae bacterium]
MSDIVIDASCVLSYLLNQEGSEIVVKKVGNNQLIAPTCLPFEIGNAVSKLIKRKFISIFEGVAVYHQFVKIPIRLVDPDIPNSIVIAGETDSYAYDSYYLNVASQMALPLFSFDEKMNDTAKNRGIKCL